MGKVTSGESDQESAVIAIAGRNLDNSPSLGISRLHCAGSTWQIAMRGLFALRKGAIVLPQLTCSQNLFNG